MNGLNSIETKLAQLYDKLPDLPRGARRWIAQNSWWIVLVFAILGALGVLGQLRSVVPSAGSPTYNALNPSYGSGFFNTITLLSLISAIITTVMYFVAVKPLRNMQKRGWNLVLYAQLVGLAFALVTLVLTVIVAGSALYVTAFITGFVIGLLLTALWLYVVFQIRGEFGSRRAEAAEAEIVAKK